MSDIRNILEKWDLEFFNKIINMPHYVLEDYNFSDYLSIKSLGKHAASDDEINKLKERFGSYLCPDIEEFYRITNGWDMRHASAGQPLLAGFKSKSSGSRKSAAR